MSSDMQLFQAIPAVPVFKPELAAVLVEQKNAAIAAAALIGRVANKAENDAVTDARKVLRNLSSFIDRERKKMTEPFIEAQRAMIRAVEPHIDELKREDGRLESLQKEFVLAEQRRIREEQEAQARELARIEAERQAELKRIADDQARVEREAREAREAAERAAKEAKNKKEREAAAKAFVEAEAKRKEALAAAAIAEEESRRVQALADAQKVVESKPVEITRTSGQTVRKVWKISQINDFQLLKARPDLVRKIEWDKVAITEALNRGEKLPGVTAEEDLRVGTRGGKQTLIEV